MRIAKVTTFVFLAVVAALLRRTPTPSSARRGGVLLFLLRFQDFRERRSPGDRRLRGAEFGRRDGLHELFRLFFGELGLFRFALEGQFQVFLQYGEFTLVSTLDFVVFGVPKLDVESGCMIVFDFCNIVNLPQAKFKSCRMHFLIFGDFGTLSVNISKSVSRTFTNTTFSEGMAEPTFQTLMVENVRIYVFSKLISEVARCGTVGPVWPCCSAGPFGQAQHFALKAVHCVRVLDVARSRVSPRHSSVKRSGFPSLGVARLYGYCCL